MANCKYCLEVLPSSAACEASPDGDHVSMTQGDRETVSAFADVVAALVGFYKQEP